MSISSRELLRHKVLTHFNGLPSGVFHDAIEVFDDPEVRAVCSNVNDVSTKLSEMFKSEKKQLTRMPTTRIGSPVRYAYSLPIPGSSAVVSAGKPSKRIAETALLKLVKPVNDVRPEITVTSTGISIISDKYKLTIEL